MRNVWVDVANLQFSRDRVAAVKDVAPDRLQELEVMDRKHADLYRMQPFLAGPDLAAKLRTILSQSSFGTS